MSVLGEFESELLTALPSPPPNLALGPSLQRRLESVRACATTGRVRGSSRQLVFASITAAAPDVHCCKGIGNKSTEDEAPKTFFCLGDSGSRVIFVYPLCNSIEVENQDFCA